MMTARTTAGTGSGLQVGSFFSFPNVFCPEADTRDDKIFPKELFVN
jgi:hypothetical protein